MSSNSATPVVGTDDQAASSPATATQPQKAAKVSHGRGGMLLPLSTAQHLIDTDRTCKHWRR